MQSPFRRDRRGIRAGAATAVTAVAALCVSGALTAPAAAAPHGERAPAAAQATATSAAGPGDVVAAEPSAFRILPGVPTLTRAWKVQYASTDASGKPNTVSGTVIVPLDGRTTTRPLVTYAMGTVGMGDQCAPSATFPAGNTTEAPLIKGALLRGWAVVVTDYEGLGTPGDHTYTVGRAAGTAVLDAARAAQRLPEAQQSGVTESSPVGIMGYSQGGQASAWAAELQRTYAPELNVKGTASGGVPADLPKVAAYNNGDEESALVLMAAIGHDAAYPGLGLNSYLTDEGRKLADGMRNGCLSENSDAGANKSIDDVTVRNPLDQPDWQQRLAADRLGGTAPGHPVYLYHAGSDEIIPFEVGRQLRADWCARGNSVEWHTYPLVGHATAAVLGSVPAMNWLSDRFADKPARSDCGS